MDNYWDELMGDDEHAATYMETYGEGPGFQTRHVVGEFINEGETVLDVGCGPGWNLEHFRQFGPHISAYKGLDYSKRFIRVASQRPGNQGNFEVGDVRKIKEADHSWDVVILQDVLEHTNGYKKPIKEALRVAKKRVIITFWHLDGNEGREHINDDGKDGYGAWYDRSELEFFLTSLPYVWHHTEVKPESKNHKWDFYIIEERQEDA